MDVILAHRLPEVIDVLKKHRVKELMLLVQLSGLILSKTAMLIF